MKWLRDLAARLVPARAGTTKALGDEGQRQAERFLKSNGCTVLERNWRSRRGEIDIVVRQGRSLVFVEVKRRASAEQGAPVMQVRPAQQRRCLQAAKHYLAVHPPEKWITEIRYDVVGVLMGERAKPEFEWVRNGLGHFKK